MSDLQRRLVERCRRGCFRWAGYVGISGDLIHPASVLCKQAAAAHTNGGLVHSLLCASQELVPSQEFARSPKFTQPKASAGHVSADAHQWAEVPSSSPAPPPPPPPPPCRRPPGKVTMLPGAVAPNSTAATATVNIDRVTYVQALTEAALREARQRSERSERARGASTVAEVSGHADAVRGSGQRPPIAPLDGLQDLTRTEGRSATDDVTSNMRRRVPGEKASIRPLDAAAKPTSVQAPSDCKSSGGTSTPPPKKGARANGKMAALKPVTNGQRSLQSFGFIRRPLV